MHTHACMNILTMQGKWCGTAQVGSQLGPGLPWATLGYLREPCAKGPGVSEVRAVPTSMATETSLAWAVPSQSLRKSGNSTETSCSLDFLQTGAASRMCVLVARFPTSLGVYHEGSEATSSKFHYLGPFLQSELPKAPSGLLTAPPPRPGHLHTNVQHSPPHGSWGTYHVPSLERRVEFRPLFSDQFSVLVPLRASPASPLHSRDDVRDHVLGTSLSVGEVTPTLNDVPRT